MSDSAEWIIFADAMIREFGRATEVTFTRPNNSSYDPSLLEGTEAAPTTYNVPAAPLEFTLRERQLMSVTEGMKKLWIPGGTGYAPMVDDTVTLEQDYRVMTVMPFETESVNCAYLLYIGN